MTLGETLNVARRRLAEAGAESPATDARVLASAALGIDRVGLLSGRDRPLASAAAAAYMALVERRARGEPVSRILGRREFWSLDLAVSPAVLDPRPDSEAVVEAALALLPDRGAPLRLLDLGVGSGCLLLALLSELPAAFGIGLDASEAALRVAADNARRLGLAGRAGFVAGWWADALAGPFDLIVANPPYVRTGEIAGLAPEVARFDPPAALDGGADGLDAYRALAEAIPRLLAPQGVAVLEIGAGQGPAVRALFARTGLTERPSRADLSGVERALAWQKILGMAPACG